MGVAISALTPLGRGPPFKGLVSAIPGTHAINDMQVIPELRYLQYLLRCFLLTQLPVLSLRRFVEIIVYATVPPTPRPMRHHQAEQRKVDCRP